MASLRPGTRKDGSTYVQVLYRLDGKQSSTSFEDLASAQKFQKLGGSPLYASPLANLFCSKVFALPGTTPASVRRLDH
jgi:hypothetical protein